MLGAAQPAAAAGARTAGRISDGRAGGAHRDRSGADSVFAQNSAKMRRKTVKTLREAGIVRKP